MKLSYVVNDGKLIDVIDVVTDKSICKDQYIEEIRVPEGTEVIAALFINYIGAIGRLFIPKSVKLIESYVFTGRSIEEIHYQGNIIDLAAIKTKYSPEYCIHLIYCNDGVINFDDEYYINELNYPGTITECENEYEKKNGNEWIYRRSKVIHCTDGDIIQNTNMQIDEYLKDEKEKLPEWLKSYRDGIKPDMKKVLHSKSVYYPGAGTDIQPIETFRKNDIAHLFIYVDYWMDRDRVISTLKTDEFIHGYECMGIENLRETDLVQNGWVKHIQITKSPMQAVKGYGLLAIFEKKSSYKIKNEPERFAILYLGADGIATYDALFANNNVVPYILILQDHGFGGNYDRFGAGGFMERIAVVSEKYPKYILSAENTNIWDGYTQADNVDAVYGGMHHNKRNLWTLKADRL